MGGFLLSRIANACSAFFGILFGGKLPDGVARALGLVKAARRSEAPKPQEVVLKPSDGALQVLGLLQRDARLLDFLMEDIAPYSDEQVGAAVRNIHTQSRAALRKHFTFAPIIDGVEGAFAKSESAGAVAKDPAALKFLGNLPAQGKPSGGILRHKGWRVDDVRLPSVTGKVNLAILAPAELEVE
jgi:hypothetical protein